MRKIHTITPLLYQVFDEVRIRVASLAARYPDLFVEFISLQDLSASFD